MGPEAGKLKLGKGSAFVKSRLKYLRQEDVTWEADFFPIPCSGGRHDSVWMGLILSHAHEYVLAQRTFEEPPTVNDLARLLADAMQRPMSGPIHRPRRLYLRAKPEWAELLPHLEQIGIQVTSQETLPKWEEAFGDLQAQVEQARSGQPAAGRKRLPKKDAAAGKGQGQKQPSRSKPPALQDTVYQFKITLLDSKPPIWRRIQVKDCTLDKLHEHIQTALGWTNSHLHHFRIGEQLYGDPDLMQENFEEMGYKDSTTTRISDILPKAAKRFRFGYEYDFGDSWDHEVVFEGLVPAEPKKKYPLCVEGARACPPEDCGGIWGYADFLEAIRNPEHEQHEELLEWAGGSFDPEAFDPVKATREMRRGLPNWRE